MTKLKHSAKGTPVDMSRHPFGWNICKRQPRSMRQKILRFLNGSIFPFTKHHSKSAKDREMQKWEMRGLELGLRGVMEVDREGRSFLPRIWNKTFVIPAFAGMTKKSFL